MWWVEAVVIFTIGAVVGGYFVYNHYFPRLGQFQSDLRQMRDDYEKLNKDETSEDIPALPPVRVSKRLTRRRANVGKRGRRA